LCSMRVSDFEVLHSGVGILLWAVGSVRFSGCEPDADPGIEPFRKDNIDQVIPDSSRLGIAECLSENSNSTGHLPQVPR